MSASFRNRRRPSFDRLRLLGRARSTFRASVALVAFALVLGFSGERAEARPPETANDEGRRIPRPRAEVIELAPGEQRVLSAKGVQSYSEGTRGIVDVRLTKDGEQFILVGLEPGRTSLLLLMNGGEQRDLTLVVGDPSSSPELGESVHKRENVRLDFYFVEIDRTYRHRIGVDPAEGVAGPVVGGSFDFLSQSFQSATAVVEDQALLRLELAQASGFAKLSRKAAVITENYQRSTLSGGGEVNIPLTGSLSTGIHRISYGSTISVEPRFDARTNRLQIAISADVSDLTDDRGSGAPGRMTSSIQTTVNVELGQAVVLAGLSSASETKSRSGLPLLSQIPVLGLLFGSDSVTRNLTDHVVFIVPTVSETPSETVREDIEAALSAFAEFDGGREQPERLRKTWRKP